jgi:transcriptional regulator with XRE-family HTH domain
MSLRALREAAGLTQEQLASATGLHQTTISDLELGQRVDVRLSTIRALAKALDRSTDEIADVIARGAVA